MKDEGRLEKEGREFRQKEPDMLQKTAGATRTESRESGVRWG